MSEESLEPERHEEPGWARRVAGGSARAACSPLGLVALVALYVLLGALLFEYLESGPELQKSSAIQRSREECLKELWAITGISLQKKWKGLRDGFVREMKKKKTTPSGSGASDKTKYMYFERLMFLERSIHNKTTDSNINTTPATAEEQDFSGDGEDVMRPPVSQSKKKKKLNAADEEFLAIIKTNLASKRQPDTSNQMESDDDKLFCLSLHKELLKVPEENRLQTKIDLMKVLQAKQSLSQKPSTARSAYLPSTQYHFQTGMTQRGQRDYFEETGYNTIDPSTSSFPPATFSSYNRGYCTVQRNTPSTTSPYNNPTTPSPASTQDSQESELMELYGD